MTVLLDNETDPIQVWAPFAYLINVHLSIKNWVYTLNY